MVNRNNSLFIIFCICFLLSIPVQPYCQPREEPEGKNIEKTEDILGGFEDFADIAVERAEGAQKKSSWWDIDGFFRVDASYNYAHNAPVAGQPDYRGLSKLRSAVQLEIPISLPKDWKGFASGQAFYDFSYVTKDRGAFSDELLDLYESEAELREIYLSGAILPNLDIKIGRQIVVWGFADYIRVVDVLNPLDNREPGLVDIEDLRLPVAMSRIDYYIGDWRLMGVAAHEIYFNKDPVYNSDFFPSNQPSPDEKIPSSSLENTEYGFALTKTFTGWDIGFFWARVFNDAAHMDIQSSSSTLQHSSVSMGGIALNLAWGNWLFKTESAFLDGIKFANLPGKTRSRLDAMFGIEYSGFNDATIALEIVNSHINNFDSMLEEAPDFAQQDITQYVIVYTGDFMRQRLHLVALASFFGSKADQGNFQRYSIGYDLYDSFTISLGILNFYSGKDYFITESYKDNDRLFLDAKYSF